jgi:hypothetical protein
MKKSTVLKLKKIGITVLFAFISILNAFNKEDQSEYIREMHQRAMNKLFMKNTNALAKRTKIQAAA